MAARKGILGFTLVELLIVISLLGAIATIVIATINPIEQANRARDTRFKTDGAQLISATDRYFAATNEFPWVTNPGTLANEDEYGFVSASDIGTGICGDASCGSATPGTLISNDELKPEFLNRDFIQKGNGTDNSKKIFMGKALGASSSLYACFIPLSKTNRQKAIDDGNVFHIASGGVRSDGTGDCTAAANWVTTGGGCYVCVPE